MSKAILIIDKPERWCVMCPCYELESGTCQALPNDDPLDHYDINDNRIIPKDCPLKEYKEAIPIEWLKAYFKKCLSFDDRVFIDNEDSNYDIVIDKYKIFEEWEKENADTN